MDPTAIDPENRVDRLDEHECWRRLLANRLGRIAFAVDGRVEIQPMHYVVRGRRVVMRTAADARLLRRPRPSVPFEIDGWDRRTAWSVIARGEVARSHDAGGLAIEDEVALARWVRDEGERGEVLAVLTVHEVTGREFRRDADVQEQWFL